MFVMVVTVLGITAVGRQTSTQYTEFAGLYDLALSANERTMQILDRSLDNLNEDHLIFRNGEFFIDEHLIWEQLINFLDENFGFSSGEYYYSYNLSVATGIYHVRTYIYPRQRAFELRSVASKAIDGQIGTPIRVYARLTWPNLRDIEVTPMNYIWHSYPLELENHSLSALIDYGIMHGYSINMEWILGFVSIIEFEIISEDVLNPQLTRVRRVAN